MSIPSPAVYQPHTDIDGLGVFDTYPAVFTVLAKQLLKVLPVKVMNRLARQVF